MDSLWLKLRSIEQVAACDWRHPLGYLSAHLLVLPVNEELSAVVDGRMLQLQPGEIFIGLPGQLLHIPESRNDGELFVILFDVWKEEAGVLRAAERDGLLTMAGSVPVPISEAEVQLCRRVATDWRLGETAGMLRAQAAFYELMSRLQENAERGQSGESAALSRTRAYMERHFDRNITIDELARMAGLSRYYYMRLFKTTYGVSAMSYLTELRMNQAKLLMEQPRPKLREIAGLVGYSDEFYFIRKFKQQVGIPPATYIRNRRRRVAAYSFPNIGQLLALQIVPFAAPMDHAWTDRYRRRFRADIVSELSHEYEFNLAALRHVNPDYIIGVDAFLPPKEQERIREIAPALFVPWRDDDWRGHLRLIADFLEMPGEAEEWLSQYDRQAAQMQQQIRQSVGRDKVLIVHLNRDGYHVYGRKTVAGVLYEDLGLAVPERARRIESRETVSLCELAEFEADRILLMLSGEEHIRSAWERLKASQDWQRHAAPLSRRVTPIPVWPWFDYSAYTQQLFLQNVPAIFNAASFKR